MDIKMAIAHRLIKEAHSAQCATELAKQPLAIDGKLTKLVNDIRHVYNKIGRGYGVFSQDSRLAQEIEPLLNDHTDLMSMSTAMMERLRDLITGVTLATGGYYLFVLYRENNHDYFLIAALKSKTGLLFNEQMVLVEQPYLDIDDLHEAVRVNLDAWRTNTENYLSFAKRRRLDSMTRYFIAFVGCEEFQDAKQLSNVLSTAIKNFSEHKQLSDNETRHLEKTAFEYFEQLAHNGEPVHIEAVANVIWPQDPHEFITFVHDNHPVNDGFIPDIRTFKTRLTRLDFKLEGGKIRFSCDRDFLYTQRVVYDPGSQTLTINQVPPDVID